MSLETADSNIHIRARADDRDLVDRAAELVGANRSQFIMAAAVAKAKDIILDQSSIYLNSTDFDHVLKMLDAPKSQEELEGIKRLMATRPPWE
jgi:uncharacterized protein (DUF1778 family)